MATDRIARKIFKMRLLGGVRVDFRPQRLLFKVRLARAAVAQIQSVSLILMVRDVKHRYSRVLRVHRVTGSERGQARLERLARARGAHSGNSRRREKWQGSIHRAVAASRRRGVDNRVHGRDHVSHHVASQDHLGVATRRGGVSRAGEEDVFETRGQTRADEKGAREVIGRTHRQ